MANEVESIRTENSNRVFDLGGLSQPEAEEALPFDLEELYQSVK